jgi:hypothetical protein
MLACEVTWSAGQAIIPICSPPGAFWRPSFPADGDLGAAGMLTPIAAQVTSFKATFNSSNRKRPYPDATPNWLLRAVGTADAY